MAKNAEENWKFSQVKRVGRTNIFTYQNCLTCINTHIYSDLKDFLNEFRLLFAQMHKCAF